MTVLVGTIMFLGSFGAILLVTQDSGLRAVQRQEDVSLDLNAERLAEAILGSAGVGWYANPACVGTGGPTTALDGDNVQRMGLAAEACGAAARDGAYNLSFDKLADLSAANFTTAAANDHLDYDEARASLGLVDGDLNFHIRAWPLLPTVEALIDLGHKDPYSRVAYIGDYQSEDINGPIGYVIEKTCGYTDLGAAVSVWMDVTNNGTVPTAVEGSFSVPLDEENVVYIDHSGALAPTATTRLSATLTKSLDWQWAGTPQVTVVVSDVVRELGACTIDLSSVTMTAAGTATQVMANAASLESLLAGGATSLKVFYGSYDGDGDSVSYSNWKLEIYSSLGVLVGADSNLNNRGWETFTLTLPDTYEIRLKSLSGAALDFDNVTVAVNALESFLPQGVAATTYIVGAPVVPESAFVAAIVEDFDPYVYDVEYDTGDVPYQAGGDVYPDLKNVLNNDLAALLLGPDGTGTTQTYSAIVVGSNVDHNAMTSAAAKQAIRDWVFAGGFLIVFGSEEQSVTWLQPIFHSAISSASGGLSTPDATHPVLHTPNELDYVSFDTGGLAWQYNSGSDAYFTHVIKQGEDDVLGVSDAGAFGEGGVLLSTYRPYDLQGTGASGACTPTNLQGDCAALQLVHNYLVLGYRDLYVDYGPEIPEGQAAAVSRHIATTFHPDLGENVDMAVQVHVFR